MHYLDHSPPKSLQVGDLFIFEGEFDMVYQVRLYSSIRPSSWGLQAVPAYRAHRHINGEVLVHSRPFSFVNDAINVSQIDMKEVRLLYNFISHKSEF